MNEKIAKLLRKFALKARQPYKTVKRVYRNFSPADRKKFTEGLKKEFATK